jgi:hypothetical protein
MIDVCTMLVGREKEQTDLLVLIFEDVNDAQIQAENWKTLDRFSDIQLVNVNLVRRGHLTQVEELPSDSSEARPSEAGLQSADSGNVGADGQGDDVRTAEV